MAVARVFGRIDGIEIVLDQKEGDRWSVPVPMDQDGEYAVEIIAEDEAGNQAYLARLLFCVDSTGLCVHVIPLPYMAVLLEPSYRTILEEPSYKTVFEEPAYQVKLLKPECSRQRER